MSTGKIILITLLAGFISVGAGILANKYLQPAKEGKIGDPSLIPEPLQVRTSLPEFNLPDLQGRERHSSQWAGKLLVLNFWATWCPPCRKETPEFVALQKEFANKVQFVGIAIDDEQPVREFADTFAVNYPLLLGDVGAVALSKQLGNRYEGLPFTVVAEPGGNVVLRHTGGLERDQLEPLLRELTDAG